MVTVTTGPAPQAKPRTEPVRDDEYCVRVRRFGALDVEETAGRVDRHRTTHAEVEDVIDRVLSTLCPGDRAEITLWRGRDA